MDVRSPGRWICRSMAGARDYSNRHGFCDLGTLAWGVQLESGVVTFMEGHEVIRSGPYRAVRPPIYRGILLALPGASVAVDEVGGLRAVAIALNSFYQKARREESFLSLEFGPGWREHRRHTGMFRPKLSG